MGVEVALIALSAALLSFRQHTLDFCSDANDGSKEVKSETQETKRLAQKKGGNIAATC